jgi:hypothetical protein
MNAGERVGFDQRAEKMFPYILRMQIINGSIWIETN